MIACTMDLISCLMFALLVNCLHYMLEETVRIYYLLRSCRIMVADPVSCGGLSRRVLKSERERSFLLFATVLALIGF